MGKDTGFLEVDRQGPAMRQPEERVKDTKNITCRLANEPPNRPLAAWTVVSRFVTLDVH